MKVRYTGDHTGGVFVPDDSQDFMWEAPHGEVVELPDQLARKLIKENPDAWQSAESKTKKDGD